MKFNVLFTSNGKLQNTVVDMPEGQEVAPFVSNLFSSNNLQLDDRTWAAISVVQVELLSETSQLSEDSGVVAEDSEVFAEDSEVARENA